LESISELFKHKYRILLYLDHNPEPILGVKYLCIRGIDGDLVFEKRKFYLLKMPLLNLVFGV
jgi:hypothetical protein